MRRYFYLAAALAHLVVALAGAFLWSGFFWAFAIVTPLTLVGIRDATQRRRAVLRNFPVIGHFRYLFEAIRPEMYQYFIESETDGAPINREFRSVIYQRAKGELDTLPFGTQRDVYAEGYEWVNHSLTARPPLAEPPRVLIGKDTCEKPYAASLLNVSAMSYGALSKNAILALSKGAAQGGFAHNTGEGGISPYHLAGGADLIWQIGTGYFGCRDENGNFDEDRFRANATLDQVKMIEVKLSQGAKPGHGGILPAAKVTPEIAAIRHVPMGHDVLSPPAHRAFDDPGGLLRFVRRLRELSGGKPVGFKLCIGEPSEFLSICKAMVETRLHPDFITVDGGEGGTGAAPLEFSNSIGTPLSEALVFVHNALVGFDLRDKVKVIAGGKIITGFHMASRMALGADLCYSARAMMIAIGCIQARRCNSNHCPVGVATQDPGLAGGLDPEDKAARVARYHHDTVHSLLEIAGAAGHGDPAGLTPDLFHRRIGPSEVKCFDEIHEFIEPGALLYDPVPERFERAWYRASAERFR